MNINIEKYLKLKEKDKRLANKYIAEHNNLVASTKKSLIKSTDKITISSFLQKDIDDAPNKKNILLLDVNSDIALRMIQDKCTLKICILNFADSIVPGGGYLYGLSTQEEELCRVAPGLYPSLAQTTYYPYNNYNTVLYTQNVLFIRDSFNNYTFLNKAYCADVITSAAPNIHIQKFDKNKLFLTAKTIFLLPKIKYNCDIIILGAWGNGDFGNDPYITAHIFANLVVQFGNYYKLVCFSIPNKLSKNYKVYYEIFKKYNLI